MLPAAGTIVNQSASLTQKERAEIQQYFTKIVSKMKKHGLPDVALLKKAFDFAYGKHGNTRSIPFRLARSWRILDMKVTWLHLLFCMT